MGSEKTVKNSWLVWVAASLTRQRRRATSGHSLPGPRYSVYTALLKALDPRLEIQASKTLLAAGQRGRIMADASSSIFKRDPYRVSGCGCWDDGVGGEMRKSVVREGV